MWEFDYKESWVLKNWCFWSVVLERTLESPLDCKEIQPVHPKGDQSLIFIERTDAKAETLILWPPDAKNWLIGKDPDAGKDWRPKEKGMTEDEMVGWYHRLDGDEFEQAPGVGDGQGSLACWELDTIEQLNWTINQFQCWCSGTYSYPTLWDSMGHIACQAPLSIVSSQQEYWSELPFSPPGDLPDPGIILCLLQWEVDSLSLSHQGSPNPRHWGNKTLIRCDVYL